MRASQWKVAAVMIEIDIVPTRRIMTNRAILAILTVVGILLLMAGKTIRRRTFVLPILMARFTGDFAMPAFEFERGKIVIEFCRGPSIRGVTLTAVRAEAALVRIIVEMTGMAVLWCHSEIAQRACVDVTLDTGEANVLASGFEGKAIVVEISPEPVYPIMTIKTSRTKGQLMRGHKGQVHLAVTGITGAEGERCDIALMTVTARERFPRSCELMSL
jgi:hypothetical protein